ncbi:MAG: M28 family metallopeptidase [Dokdonella sp.]|nr:M28 family metallopeptidase [Dokdonella sp.]
MANMDMIGWSPDAQLGVDLDTSSVALRQRFGDAAAAYVPELAVTISLLNCCSDHMPYQNRGVPAIMSLHRNYGAYVHYHQSTDVPANLGLYARAIGGAIVRMNVAALAGLSGASDRLFADAWEAAPAD